MSIIETLHADVEAALQIGYDACRAFEAHVGKDICRWNDDACRDVREAERMLRALAGVQRGRRPPRRVVRSLTGFEAQVA